MGSRKQWSDKVSFLWQPSTKAQIREELPEANTNHIPRLMLHVIYAGEKKVFLLIRVSKNRFFRMHLICKFL